MYQMFALVINGRYKFAQDLVIPLRAFCNTSRKFFKLLYAIEFI